MSAFSSKGVVHSRMVGIQLVSVRRTKGTLLTRSCCVAVRTILRWLFWTLLRRILIDAAFAVRRQCVSQMDEYSGFYGFLERVGDVKFSVMASADLIASLQLLS